MALAVKAILGRKIGMTQAFNEEGRLQALTAVEAGPCYVTQVKTPQKEGYSAIQIGFLEKKNLNSPEKGHLKPVGKLLSHVREFRVAEASAFAVGQILDAGLFEKGEKVDVVGISKGKGFAGGMKRYHFGGGPKTHGQSDTIGRSWTSAGSARSATSAVRQRRSPRGIGWRSMAQCAGVSTMPCVSVTGMRSAQIVPGVWPSVPIRIPTT